MAKSKLVCRDCDVELNHHAAKLVQPRSAAEAARVDPELGGLVAESHTCPSCGHGESRMVGGGSESQERPRPHG